MNKFRLAVVLSAALFIAGGIQFALSQPVPVNPPIGPCTSAVFCTASATGTGSVGVLQQGPTINNAAMVAPVLGTPASGNAANITNLQAAAMTGQIAIANGGTGAATASAARTNLGLVIGTNVEAWGASLDAINAATWTGAPSITTLGTITTGVWNGTAITNTNLANSATTVNGQSCVLGATCTISAASTSVTPNSTLCQSCSANFLLYSDGTKVQQAAISNFVTQGGGTIGQTTGQSLTNSPARVTFDTAGYSSGGVVTCDTTTTKGLCTVNTTGKYHITCTLLFVGTSPAIGNSVGNVSIFKNGVALTVGGYATFNTQASGVAAAGSVTAIANVSLAATDTFDCRAASELTSPSTNNGTKSNYLTWNFGSL